MIFTVTQSGAVRLQISGTFPASEGGENGFLDAALDMAFRWDANPTAHSEVIKSSLLATRRWTSGNLTFSISAPENQRVDRRITGAARDIVDALRDAGRPLRAAEIAAIIDRRVDYVSSRLTHLRALGAVLNDAETRRWRLPD